MKVALDIGGANIKYCIQENNKNFKSGSIPITSHHVFSFESELEFILKDIIKGATSIFFTSTCELLYRTKIEAERRIIELLRKVNKMNNQSCNFFIFLKMENLLYWKTMQKVILQEGITGILLSNILEKN